MPIKLTVTVVATDREGLQTALQNITEDLNGQNPGAIGGALDLAYKWGTEKVPGNVAGVASLSGIPYNEKNYSRA